MRIFPDILDWIVYYLLDPSTTAISSLVNPYNSYTSRSIAHSSSLVFARFPSWGVARSDGVDVFTKVSWLWKYLNDIFVLPLLEMIQRVDFLFRSKILHSIELIIISKHSTIWIFDKSIDHSSILAPLISCESFCMSGCPSEKSRSLGLVNFLWSIHISHEKIRKILSLQYPEYIIRNLNIMILRPTLDSSHLLEFIHIVSLEERIISCFSLATFLEPSKLSSFTLDHSFQKEK